VELSNPEIGKEILKALLRQSFKNGSI